MAIIIGGYFANIKAPKVSPGMLHGAYLQLVTGLALTGLAEAMVDEGEAVNHMKIGIKLVLALAVAVFAFLGKRKEKANPEQGTSAGMSHATGIVAVIAVIIAVFLPGTVTA
ncbi:hypothetical protein BSP109_02240 [Brevibacterium sp. Mu109]|uniref:Integral membrane protein n=2 Tax=Brevibacteriaceae TaxID=85019 RepID=A0A1X6XPY3_9MICO|nr:hypothetical protein FM105_14305 [Brevibacterium yomogidense]SMX87849.1 hypothetical protein BSP109_02240 [Brevibacterium sp. Mu109]